MRNDDVENRFLFGARCVRHFLSSIVRPGLGRLIGAPATAASTERFSPFNPLKQQNTRPKERIEISRLDFIHLFPPPFLLVFIYTFLAADR